MPTFRANKNLRYIRYPRSCLGMSLRSQLETRLNSSFSLPLSLSALGPLEPGYFMNDKLLEMRVAKKEFQDNQTVFEYICRACTIAMQVQMQPMHPSMSSEFACIQIMQYTVETLAWLLCVNTKGTYIACFHKSSPNLCKLSLGHSNPFI